MCCKNYDYANEYIVASVRVLQKYLFTTEFSMKPPGGSTIRYVHYPAVYPLPVIGTYGKRLLCSCCQPVTPLVLRNTCSASSGICVERFYFLAVFGEDGD